MTATTAPTDARTNRRFTVSGGDEIHVSLASPDEEASISCFATAESKTVEAFCTIDQGGTPKRLPACLVNISHSGAKLLIAASTAHEGEFELTLRAADVDLNVTLAANARWLEALDEQITQLGCEFLKPLPDDVIPRLAAAAYIERRRDDRCGAGMKALVRQQLARGGSVSVQIEEDGLGGVRLYSDQPVAIGERLLLELNDRSGKSLRIPAKTLWQIEDGEGYLTGCDLLNADESQRLGDLLHSDEGASFETSAVEAVVEPSGSGQDDERLPGDTCPDASPAGRTGEEAPEKTEDGDYPRQLQRVMVLTSWCKIEGTYHFMRHIRLSDAMNADIIKNQRYLPLSDVSVQRLESGEQLFRTKFLMVSHTQITGIAPLEAVNIGDPDDSATASHGDEFQNLANQMNM